MEIYLTIAAAFAGLALAIYKICTKPALRKHIVFSYLVEFIDRTIPNWGGGQCAKKNELIKSCVDVYAVNYKKWLIKTIDDDFSESKLIKSLAEMLLETEYRWHAKGVPTIFITKWKSYVEPSLDNLFRYIKQSRDYTNEYTQKVLLLTMAQFVFFSSLHDLDRVCSELNGELEAYLADN